MNRIENAFTLLAMWTLMFISTILLGACVGVGILFLTKLAGLVS